MRQTVVYERNSWKVTCYGGGIAYALDHTQSGSSVFFQSDDALAFEEHTLGPDGFFVDNCEERFGDYSEIMQSGREG